MNSSDGKYHFFWSGPFSQWQHSEFDFDNRSFVTAEQAMMHAKAVLFEDHEIAAKILATRDPGRQKALGRQVNGFDEATWDAAKIDIVYRVNLAKFRQNKGLRRKLFRTEDRLLVEASPVDTIWGIGLDARACTFLTFGAGLPVRSPELSKPDRNALGFGMWVNISYIGAKER